MPAHTRTARKRGGEFPDHQPLVRTVCELLAPIAEELRREVMASAVIHTDDTPVTLAQPVGQHGSRQAREGACWAHVRRKFVDAERIDPVLAKAAVDRIRVLFQLEEATKDRSDEACAALLLLTEFRAWLELTATKALPKSPLGQAVTCVTNQCDALTRYVEDGRLALSNNAAERALRPFTVGRKNWPFFLREGGGRTAAILMGLLMAAKAVGVEPPDYFNDVLLRLSTCTDVRQLTPHGSREHFATEVTERRHALLQQMIAKA